MQQQHWHAYMTMIQCLVHNNNNDSNHNSNNNNNNNMYLLYAARLMSRGINGDVVGKHQHHIY